MTTAEPGVMSRLKTETAELHDAAERNELMTALMKGSLAREDYVRHLEQLMLVHLALEGHLWSARETVPAIRDVVEEYQLQVPYLKEDLEFFGADAGNIDPLPRTARFLQHIDEVAASAPLGLLGFHYVLEGSNNGGRFIAKGVGRSFGLEPGPGLRYLDPYGESQRERWAKFKDDMGAVGFSDEEQDLLVAHAKDMFVAITEIGNELVSVNAT